MSGSTHKEHDQLKSLGKYQIRKKLGAGGMGTVFLAVDQQLNRTVALKVLPKERAENPTLVKRFKSEAKAAAQLEHKNIIRVYETGEIDGFLYIALEYVDGIDVHELVVKRDVIPVKRSIDIIRQVTLALEHADSKKIVHRDIKPANLMIKRDGSVKLADMGLARVVDDTLETGITRAGMTVGTVDYMSPEQARSSKSADIRSDIYSLGCTWYHMLTGGPPFPAGGMTAKLQAHSTSKRPDPRSENPAVPEALVAVLHRMMARKPKDRYQSPRELLDDLELLSKRSSHINAEVLEALAAEADTGSGQMRARQSSGTMPALPPKESYKPVDLTTGGKFNVDLIRFAIPVVLVLAVVGILFWASREGSDALSGGVDTGNAANPYATVKKGTEATDEADEDDGEDISSDDVQPEAKELSGLSPSDAIGPGTVVAVPFPGAEDSQTTSDGVQLLPNWVDHFRTPPQAAEKKLVVTRQPQGAGQFKDLNQAISSLPRQGGVIQLDGDGPFTLNPASIRANGEIRLTSAEGYSPVVHLVTESLSGSGESFLNVQTARLVIENLHFVMTNPPPDLTFLQIKEGDLVLQNSSFTVCNLEATTTTAISLTSQPQLRGTRPQQKADSGRCLLENVVLRGNQLTAVKLRGNACELVAGNCLMVAGRAPALVLSEAATSGPSANDVEPTRRVRLLASTVTGNETLLRFVHDPASTQPSGCEVAVKQSVLAMTSGSSTSTSATSAMVSLEGWTANLSDIGRSRALGVEWSTDESRYVGWPLLVNLSTAEEQVESVANVDEWRRFWGKPLSSDSVINASLSVNTLDDHGNPELAALDLALAEVLQSSPAETLAGYRMGDLEQLPLGLLDHVVAAANIPDDPSWLGSGLAIDGKPIQLDLNRKRDIGRLLSSGVAKDGAHLIISGTGLHELSPCVIENISLRVEFRNTGKSPFILQVEPLRGKGAPPNAAMTVRNANLDLVGARFKVPASQSEQQPPWLIALEDGSLSLRSCSIEGPSTSSKSHSGLIQFAPGDTVDEASTRAVLIEDSFLVSPGQLMSGPIAWEKLSLRNNVLVSQSEILDLELSDVKLEQRPVIELEHCTCSTQRAAIRFRGSAAADESLARLQLYVIDNLFLGGTDTGDSSPKTVLAQEAENFLSSHVSWWARRNAFAPSLPNYLETAGVAQPNRSLKEQWLAAWGDGHEVNGLSDATDVIFESPFPEWTKLEPTSFKLSSSGRASHSALDGSAAGALLAEVGADHAGTDTPSDRRRTRPSPPKKRPSGF